MPARTPWNAQASKTGTQVIATAAPNASPAPTGTGNAPAYTAPAVAAPYGNTTTAAGAAAPAVVEVTTITTVLVITSTVLAGQAAPSVPSSEAFTPLSSAPAVSPSSYKGTLPMPATTPVASSASSPTAQDTNGIPTISTKAGSAPAASGAYRRHAREIRR
ncbi:hypothetical protein DOTSEDRAFT_70678 [Dothistroma septosporum NZE10]|uniref:Uncharacterized protein n=1 Tax=Dothistroma septosporum (strain NZE10 / CBS 128990) TaxID=675120 RepID=N1PTR0_DOTSN|nr:hypothetical protein DOTSEDRAFT_70678 [Dothistroma septosporum NZE10]